MPSKTDESHLCRELARAIVLHGEVVAAVVADTADRLGTAVRVPVGTMTSMAVYTPSPNRQIERNAQLRAAARAAFPGVSIAVRNGPYGSAAVKWVDGPTDRQMSDVLRSVPSDTDGRPWAVITGRTVRPELLAVAYLRAWGNGQRVYSERDGSHQPIELDSPLPRRDRLASWQRLSDNGVDAASVTDAERGAGRVLLSLACPDVAPTALDDSTLCRQLARAAMLHGEVVLAVVADAA